MAKLSVEITKVGNVSDKGYVVLTLAVKTKTALGMTVNNFYHAVEDGTQPELNTVLDLDLTDFSIEESTNDGSTFKWLVANV